MNGAIHPPLLGHGEGLAASLPVGKLRQDQPTGPGCQIPSWLHTEGTSSVARNKVRAGEVVTAGLLSPLFALITAPFC